jgi:16S rRNA processing protein RimM
MRSKFDYLIIGKVRGPFGRIGELKVIPMTDDMRRFSDLLFVFYKDGSTYKKISVERVRYLNTSVILKLENYDSIEEIAGLVGHYLYIDRENAVKIGESCNYCSDLTECRVITTNGDEVGTVYDILNAGTCDVYVVRSDKGGIDDRLIPAVKEVVKKINVDRKEIIIEVIEGLF